MNDGSDAKKGPVNIQQLAGSWVARLRKIASVLMRFGFSSILQMIGLERYLPQDVKDDPAAAGLSPPERLRLALEDLGPAAIKLGQMLSSRGDIMPPSYVQELRRLQDDVPPFGFEQVEEIIREEFDAEIHDLFAHFETEPVASASLAQVHRATLTDGTDVAVKVQRPDVEEAVKTDLQILSWAVDFGQRHNEWLRQRHASRLVDEFRHSLTNELDFTLEASNTERLRDNLRSIRNARLPAVYHDLTTTRVLTLEWIDGVKAGDEEGFKRLDLDPKEAAHSFGTIMIHQIVYDGYFHADPHAGNVMFTRDHNVVLLDAGYATTMGEKLRGQLIRLLRSGIRRDSEDVADTLMEFATTSPDFDVSEFILDMEQLITHYAEMERTPKVGMGEMLQEMMRLIMEYRMRVPAVLPAVTKALAVTEGVCLELDPKFNFRPIVQDILIKCVFKELQPMNIIEDAINSFRNVRRYMGLLPRQLSRILNRTESGELSMHVTLDELDKPLRRIDTMINRLSLALLISSIILSSAVLTTVETASPIADVLTTVYLVGGAALGLWLLISFLRS